MSLPFDPGDASLVLQVAVFFLLILGLPFVKGIGTKEEFHNTRLLDGFCPDIAYHRYLYCYDSIIWQWVCRT
jgi:hypothetical protein